MPNGNTGIAFLPTYASNNRILNLGFQYDAVGNVTSDNLGNTYTYTAEGRPATAAGVTTTFDAFGRAVQQNRSGVSTQILYGPSGAKFAFLNGSTLIKYIDPMVAGMAAVHNGPNGQPPNSGYYQHADWLGSSRFAQDSSGNVIYDRAYAPFGEVYDETAITNRNFTGQTEDTTPGLYDFLFRQQSRTQGRWLVPDPAGMAAVDITNPQTWNRYAYLANNPLNAVDPLGLYCMWDDGTKDDNPEDGGVGYAGCVQGGGTWMDVSSVTVNGDTGETSFWQSGVGNWNGDPLQGIGIAGDGRQGGGATKTGCFARGAVTGAVATLAVGALAVGAVTVGAPVAVVTGTLGVLAVAGGVALGLDVKQQVGNKNWSGLAYDAGSFFGSVVAGGATAMPVRTGITGETSAPSGIADFFGFGKTWTPALGPPATKWLGTGPDPGAAGGSTAASGAGIARFLRGGC
ncbi:MAG: RHS repeat-associated core domain-containing protein [Candidatus Korobacteraceae bacterium]